MLDLIPVGLRHCVPTLLLLLLPVTLQAQPYDLVIAGGRVLDPATNLDAIRHVGINGGTITAISETPLAGRDTIDAAGYAVAPGFIDMNTYQHGDPLFRLRAADGVTSVLHLEDGAVDVAAYYAALEGRALIHHGVAAGHGSLRAIAQGDSTLVIVDGMVESGDEDSLIYHALSPDELDTLAALVERELRAGAVAVGYGIAYSPGTTHSEVLRLARVAKDYNASSHYHVRDFHRTRQWGEMFEMFGAALHAGGDIHINHMNSIYGSYSPNALAFLDSARAHGLNITTEAYPYTAALTFIESALFDDWEEWSDERFARYEWPPTGERLTREAFGKYREEGGVMIIHPRNPESIEEGVRACLAHPLPMIASDGAWDDGMTHPRSAGTNSRVLGRYVREYGTLTLMDAVRKMSLAPAEHLAKRVPGMANKGRVQVGADADLVVFDPDTVIDNATYKECLLRPTGIDFVLVMGVPVVRDGVIQDDVFPGRAIRGPVME